MPIFGTGVDLVEISRMRRAIYSRWSERLLSRVFTEDEIHVCKAAANTVECFAARFAAKEAVVKALGTGFSHGIAAKHIEIIGGEHVRPSIKLSGKAQAFCNKNHIKTIHISLTHTANFACAFAVAEIAS